MSNTQFLPPNTQLNNYTILRKIGSGGFGITYLVKNRLDNQFVIKELFLQGCCVRTSNTVQIQGITEKDFTDYKQKFIREGKTLNHFSHPHIVNAVDVFEENNTVYIVMEYIEGETLLSKIEQGKNGKLPLSQTLKYIKEIGNALEHIHQKNFYHRDVKPTNILIRPNDEAVLIDFGLTKEITNQVTLTQTQAFSFGYSPIEQRNLKTKLGAYTDVYALGATMYHCLCGEKPTDAMDRFKHEVTPPSQLNPLVPTLIEKAILKSLEMDETKRQQSVGEFLKEVDSLTDSGVRVEDKKKEEVKEKEEVIKEETVRKREVEGGGKKVEEGTVRIKDGFKQKNSVIDKAVKKSKIKNSSKEKKQITKTTTKESENNGFLGCGCLVFILVLAFIIGHFSDPKVNENKYKNDSDAWYNVDLSKKESIEKFISNYPNSKFIEDAERNIEELEWKELLWSKSIVPFKEFLQKYPNSNFKHIADLRINNNNIYFENNKKKIWDSIENINLIQGYNYFLKAYEENEYTDLAKDLLKEKLREQKNNLNKLEEVGLKLIGIRGGSFEIKDNYNENFYSDPKTLKIYLNSYYLSDTEITNKQFCVFLNSNYNKKSEIYKLISLSYGDIQLNESGKYQPLTGKENYPVTQVTWYGASAFCEWAGGELPTEAEWMFAASERGKIEQNYKNKATKSLKYNGNLGGDKDRYKGIAPVKKFKPNSLKLYDMAGNVSEYTSNWYELSREYDIQLNNPKGPKYGIKKYGIKKITKGCSFDEYCNYLNVILSKRSLSPNWREDDVGFRFKKK